MKPFVAQYAGRCGICAERIWEEEDTIVRIEDEWAHVDCAENQGYDIEY